MTCILKYNFTFSVFMCLLTSPYLTARVRDTEFLFLQKSTTCSVLFFLVFKHPLPSYECFRNPVFKALLLQHLSTRESCNWWKQNQNLMAIWVVLLTQYIINIPITTVWIFIIFSCHQNSPILLICYVRRNLLYIRKAI